MNLFKRVLDRLQSRQIPEPGKLVVRGNFFVEYRPLSKKYYPRLDSFYLSRDKETGVIHPYEGWTNFLSVDNYENEDAAWQVIEEYLAQ
jgi:hypothetical protein